MHNKLPRADFDSPWKVALSHAFHAFMAFYFAEICCLIDWSRRPRFHDKELAKIGFGIEGGNALADKLVEVHLVNGGAKWVMVHIEVQAQRDGALARRVLDYNYRIFKEYGRPVASLVLLADDDPVWRPHEFHYDLIGTELRISFATAKLLDFAERQEELAASRNPFALVTLAHLRTLQAHHDPDQLYAAKWLLTRLLYQHGWSKRRIIVLFKVINWMKALPESQQARYWKAILRLEKERKVEWISPLEQSFIDKGRQKGRKEGREEGRKEGVAELLEIQLAQRFGPLPPTIRKKLAKATEAQLVEWGAAMIGAPTLKQVFVQGARKGGPT